MKKILALIVSISLAISAPIAIGTCSGGTGDCGDDYIYIVIL